MVENLKITNVMSLKNLNEDYENTKFQIVQEKLCEKRKRKWNFQSTKTNIEESEDKKYKHSEIPSSSMPTVESNHVCCKCENLFMNTIILKEQERIMKTREDEIQIISYDVMREINNSIIFLQKTINTLNSSTSKIFKISNNFKK